MSKEIEKVLTKKETEQEQRRIIVDYMQKQIEAIDKFRAEIRKEYPKLFKEGDE